LPQDLRSAPQESLARSLAPLNGEDWSNTTDDEPDTNLDNNGNLSPPDSPYQRPQRSRQLPQRYRQNVILINSVTSIKPPFTESRYNEINGLLERGVFRVVDETDVPKGTRIFNSRFVDEIRNSGTNQAFEKSRLVVQAYNDAEKSLVLTQSPTIQRCSQRLLLAIATMLHGNKLNLYLRDITQAYVQSTTALTRDIFVRPPQELQLDRTEVLKITKPLYGVPEAGNHWFNTYHRHHIERLRMEQSTYDPCLLVCNSNKHKEPFGLVGLQTDDTLILANETFAQMEENELKKAKFTAKPREQLTQEHPLKFNGSMIALTNQGNITLTQTRHCKNLHIAKSSETTDIVSSRGIVRKDVDTKGQYIALRARGAYIASICQPEASFDLSRAAQVTDPQDEDFKYLNKRLQWQRDNHSRGLTFIPLDPNSIQLVTFTDSSFANNRDLSSQIGFILVLAEKDSNEKGLHKANIIHWSSIKCKRITRSVLASELYALTHGFDIATAVKSTIEKILHKPVPLTLCTDSKSLYECLVKLGTTREKRLMIDLMCLRQAYERREITEVKWIHGDTNPADAMTKAKPCQALKDLIDTNLVRLNATEWVEREGKADQED